MRVPKQKGFGTVLLIVVVVLAVAGVVGWSVYSGKKAPNNSATQSTSQATQQKQIASTAASTNNQAQQAQIDPNAGYVVIKEWGVRFRAVGGLEAAMYTITPTSTDQEDPSDPTSRPIPMAGELAVFSTKALTQYGDSCSDKVDGRNPLGKIYRSKRAVKNGEFLKQIGEYYYRYSGPQSVCSDNFKPGDDASTLQTQTLNSQFKPSIATLEAAK